MERISENLRTISLDGFTPTDNLVNDVIELSKLKGRTLEKSPPGMHLILGLRIKLGNPLTVHVLTDGVCKKVEKVKCEYLPVGYPKFLEKPFLIEAKPGSVLFDDIDAIGGFIDTNEDFITIMWSKNGTFFTRTNRPFNGVRIDQINFIPREGSFIPTADKNPNVFPFITILALMIEADKTPVKIDHGRKKSKKRKTSNSENKNPSNWVEYRVYIDAKITPAQTLKDSIPMEMKDKEKVDVDVQGFIRNQAYGPGHSLRKPVWIEAHTSPRWKKTGDKKITLDTYFKD